MRKGLANSFRFQMVLSVFGVFSLLVLSMTYILLSTIKLQSLADDGFKQERHLKSVQEALESYQQPLLEYLSTRSSNALAKLLVESQRLSSMIPDGAAASGSRSDLRERETYALIRAYLDLSEEAVSEKRGRNVDGYIGVYDRMNELLKHIETEMEIISTDRFRGQLDNYDRFISASRNVQLWNLLFILSISLFSVCLFLRSVEKMTDPMVRLSAMATELSEGNFGIDDIKLSSVYEIDHVVEAFNRMKHEMRSYIDEIRWQESIKQEYMQERVRNLKMEGLVRRMEIYTMQAQMNPHFLFNTLNTGMQLAIVEGADRTCEYMEYLSALFRHNVRSKDVIVPLRHEIEGLEYYFYILRVRFPKNLDLSLDCPEELLDACRVPASLLQPLVENCIVHAFKAQRGRSSIAVSGRLAQGRLELAVEDNGSGMEEETIAELLHPIDFEQDSPRVMGLGNVVQRLYFFYPGDPGVIRIESAIGGGTRVAISIDLGEGTVYRVLIVDDEEPVLDSYAFMLEAAGPRFSLAGMARSGYEALASLRELKPDLVFMDINIPGMDGLEVIEEVHEKPPEAVFVLSTAYERFDLARRAIPLGVFAYLVKPVTKSMFMSTLDSAAALLDKRAAPRSSADAADARRLLGEALWRGMDEAEWAAHRAALGLSSDKAAVCLAEVERDAESVFARLEKALSFQYPCLLFRTLNRGLFLIPQDADKAALEKVFAEALSAAAEPGLYLGAAVAGPRRGAELHLACAEALEELRRRKGRADAAVRERLRVLALRRKFGAEPLAEARAAFGDLWREVFAVYELPVAKAKMVALFTLLMDDCAAALPGAAGAEAAGEPSFDPAPEIMALPDLASWELWAPRAFDELQERHAAARAKAYPAPLAKALQFVAERYAEQLQLSDVAEAAQVSSAYLSRLFTEHLRTPFVDYLTALRMDKAERLLRGSSLSVKETAFAVGYKDPNYFSKIFRKETGLSPSTYAEERRSGSPGKDQP